MLATVYDTSHAATSPVATNGSVDVACTAADGSAITVGFYRLAVSQRWHLAAACQASGSA
jgi:hypothetical protein